MSVMFDDKKLKKRCSYEKPKLRIIELAAEEVLAVGCKTAFSGSAVGGGPVCMIRHCAGNGS
jgi:hypothetical protein